MLIKKSQVILKCFVDFKSSIFFTLGSEDETMFCDTQNFFQLDCRSRFSKHLMTSSPILSINNLWIIYGFIIYEIFTNQKNPGKPKYHMLMKKVKQNLLRIQDCRPFSVFNTLTGSQAEKISKSHKTWFGFLSPA